MLSNRGRRGFIALAILLCVAQSAAASDSLTLSQAQLGNIFYSTEAVNIPAQTTGDQVSWTATDFYGAVTNGGPVAVTNGSAVIKPALGRLGYFALTVNALRSGSVVATASTTFAVVAPVTVSTMSDSPFGICTHFSQGWDTSVMSLMARGGMAQFRDEQEWQYVEPVLTTPPTYTFTSATTSLYTAYMAAAAVQKLNPLTELDFENSNYDGGYTPYSSTGNTGYANYADALLAHYTTTANGTATPQIKAVEVWNEYNGDNYYHAPPNPLPAGFPSSKAVQYTAMLQTTYNAVKAQQPGVKVIGGASVPVPIPWFQSLFAAGALPYMDAADIHPYVDPPEGLETSLAALQSLMASYNKGVAKPIWVTECGFTDNIPGRQNMASYLVRIMTVMRASGVERAYWYLLFDSYPDYSGLLRGQYDSLGAYVPSAGYPAYANLIQQLYGATFVQRETTDSRTRFYQFTRGSANTPVRVLWSTSGTAQIVLSTTSALTVTNIMGEVTTVQPTNGSVTVAADINPVYITGPVTAIQEVGRDNIIADSIRDFLGTEGTGQNTWYYGYFQGTSTTSGTTYVPSAVQPLIYQATSSEYGWAGPIPPAVPALGPTLVDVTGEHPGTYNTGSNAANPYVQIWPVRRWQSSVTATAHITGYASLNNTTNGDGTYILIYVDGKQVYSSLISPRTSVNFDFTTPVQVGSNVDFVSTSGPGTDYNYDYLLYREQLSVPFPTTFAEWQGQHFSSAEMANSAISGATAAPGGDGVPNLIKYAGNLDPKTASARALPTTGVASVNGSKYLTLSFRQAVAATDLTFSAESSGSLTFPSASLTQGVVFGTAVNNGDGTQTVTYRDTVPITAGGSARFMRLRVGH